MTKLSASAMTAFLESPKAFYWHYLSGGTGQSPLQPSMARFDHDIAFGTRWAEFVHTFYTSGMSSAAFEGLQRDLIGWCPDKIRATYADAFAVLMASYNAQFRRDDGVRTADTSELRIEDDRFVARLDGISADGIIHECKATSRAPSLDAQLWRVQNSIQVKLYAVMTRARGVRIEFAYKDQPNVVFRAPVKCLDDEQLAKWQCELETLADQIELAIKRAEQVGDAAFPCHPDGCTIVTKRFVGECPWKLLCSGDPAAQHFYRPRREDIDVRTGKVLHIVHSSRG